MYRCVYKTFVRLPSWLFALASLLTLTACGLNEFKAQEAKLKPLVQRGASKQEVIGLLGSNFVYSSKQEKNQLAQFLASEPTNRLVSVRERVARWPDVMFYSTPDMMTWIFLDESGKVVDYVVGAQ